MPDAPSASISGGPGSAGSSGPGSAPPSCSWSSSPSWWRWSSTRPRPWSTRAWSRRRSGSGSTSGAPSPWGRRTWRSGRELSVRLDDLRVAAAPGQSGPAAEPLFEVQALHVRVGAWSILRVIADGHALQYDCASADEDSATDANRSYAYRLMRVPAAMTDMKRMKIRIGDRHICTQHRLIANLDQARRANRPSGNAHTISDANHRAGRKRAHHHRMIHAQRRGKRSRDEPCVVAHDDRAIRIYLNHRRSNRIHPLSTRSAAPRNCQPATQARPCKPQTARRLKFGTVGHRTD